MRLPETIETLYLDFDGFFASVHQQVDRNLRGRPVGVVPFADTDRTCVIAVSREAKLRGVKSIMPIADAKRICPDIVLVPQQPDLYRRAHNALISEIKAVIPIDAVKSIDELTCRLDDAGRRGPEALGQRIKDRLANNIGPFITSTIGFAANRQLAKMACKAGKKSLGRYGNGLTVWRPEDMPEPLLAVELEDIPGVGPRMARRLSAVGIQSTEQLYKIEPKHMRKIWNSVTGERLWYALHGYAIQAQPTERGMVGHGRVLPPASRSIAGAREISRLLTIKAARRLRRDGFYCAGIWLSISIRDGHWSRNSSLPIVNDDAAILSGLELLWRRVRLAFPNGTTIFRVSITLHELSLATERQLDMLTDDDSHRQKCERASAAIDTLNARYSRTVVSLGEWKPPAGGHVGGKISYTRIPSVEDFW